MECVKFYKYKKRKSFKVELVYTCFGSVWILVWVCMEAVSIEKTIKRGMNSYKNYFER